jgi:hypothetical protein
MTMQETVQIFGNIGEFVSAIAVVVTLVYLALQIRHSERTTRAQLSQSFSSDINAVNLMIASDPSWFELFRKASESLDALTPDERGRYGFLELSVCRTIEPLYLHYLRGLVDDDVWATQRESLVRMATTPGWRQWWQTQPFPFTPTFRALVDSIVREQSAVSGEDRIAVLYRAGKESS